MNKKPYLLFWYSTDKHRWIFDQALETKEEADNQANMFLKRIFTQVRKI